VAPLDGLDWTGFEIFNRVNIRTAITSDNGGASATLFRCLFSIQQSFRITMKTASSSFHSNILLVALLLLPLLVHHATAGKPVISIGMHNKGSAVGATADSSLGGIEPQLQWSSSKTMGDYDLEVRISPSS
jgi:hypothetical protein